MCKKFYLLHHSIVTNSQSTVNVISCVLVTFNLCIQAVWLIIKNTRNFWSAIYIGKNCNTIMHLSLLFIAWIIILGNTLVHLYLSTVSSILALCSSIFWLLNCRILISSIRWVHKSSFACNNFIQISSLFAWRFSCTGWRLSDKIWSSSMLAWSSVLSCSESVFFLRKSKSEALWVS